MENQTKSSPMDATAQTENAKGMVIASTGLVLNMDKDTIQAALHVAAEEGPERFLSLLHEIEFTLSDQYDWPWLRWRQLAESGYDTASLLPEKILGEAPTLLAQQVLDRVLAVRLGNPEATDLEGLFEGDHKDFLAAMAELPYPYLLELMGYAFYQRRWWLAGRMCRRLLRTTPGYPEKVAERVQDLAFEALFFTVYRPGTQHFVTNPQKQISALTALGENPNFAHVTNRSSIVMDVYRANCLAMEARFDDALALYQQANDRTGFRPPVFSQAQTLISIAKLQETDPEALLSWKDDHFRTEHVFRHDPQGRHVVLVACEEQYLDMFGELYTQILALTNPGLLVHFHFVNLPQSREEIAKRLDAWEVQHNIQINFSLETNRIMADMPDHRGGICVCTRYIHLPDYLDAYAGVSITDIDGWLEAEVDYLADFGGADAMISSWIWRKNTGYWRLPWGNLAGGYSSFCSTDKTKAFAELVKLYLLSVYKRNAYAGKTLFYADQAGVFLCLQYIVRTMGMKVGFLRGGFAQSEEQRFGTRHAGKQMAMQEKIEQLRAAQ